MSARLSFSALLLAAALLAGCDSDAGSDDTGSLRVAVVLEAYDPDDGVSVADARVLLSAPPSADRPHADSSMTGSDGTAAFANVPTGLYEVYVFKPGLGSGAGVARVQPGAEEVTVRLRRGVFRFPPPRVRIERYAVGSVVFAPGDTLRFEASVSDPDTPLDQLELALLTDTEGEVAVDIALEPRPYGYDRAVVQTTVLGAGRHRLTLQVKDPNDNVATDTLTVYGDAPQRPPAPQAQASGGEVTLDWSLPNDNGPARVATVVQRTYDDPAYDYADWREVARLDPIATAYRDADPGLVPDVSYRLVVRNASGHESAGRAVTVVAPSGPALEVSGIARYAPHPSQASWFVAYESPFTYDSLLVTRLDAAGGAPPQGTTLPGRELRDLHVSGTGADVRLYALFGDGRIATYDEDLTRLGVTSARVQDAGYMTVVGDVAVVVSYGFERFTVSTIALPDGALLDRMQSVHAFRPLALPSQNAVVGVAQSSVGEVIRFDVPADGALPDTLAVAGQFGRSVGGFGAGVTASGSHLGATDGLTLLSFALDGSDDPVRSLPIATPVSRLVPGRDGTSLYGVTDYGEQILSASLSDLTAEFFTTRYPPLWATHRDGVTYALVLSSGDFLYRSFIGIEQISAD